MLIIWLIVLIISMFLLIKAAGVITDWLKSLWSTVVSWWNSFIGLFTEYAEMQDEIEKELDQIIDNLETVESTDETDDSLFSEDFGSSSSSETPDPLF